MRKVLIIADKEADRRAILRSVDWNALGCVVVGEGTEADRVELIRRYDPDLVITGLKPGLGSETARIPPSLSPRTDRKSSYVRDAVAYMDGNYSDPNLTVGAVADFLGISESYLSHLFKRETGHTIIRYLTRLRVHKAAELLRDYRVKVYEVAERVGYRDVAHFSATFKKWVGVPPSEYEGGET